MHSLDLACRLALAAVFAVAAGGKLRDRAARARFVTALGDFGLPRALVGVTLATTIALAELAAAGSMLGLPRAGYPLALALLACFTAAIAAVVRRGATTACRCFGATDAPVGPSHLARNAVLATIAVVGVFAHLTAPGGIASGAPEIAAGALGALIGLALTRWDDLAFLLVPSLHAGRAPAKR